jgi:thioredoxin-related protein
MAPSVHGLEQIYGDQVNFVYLDRDKDTTVELRNQLGYVYQPHIFILDAEGNILYQRSGYVEAVELQAQIESALN